MAWGYLSVRNRASPIRVYRQASRGLPSTAWRRQRKASLFCRALLRGLAKEDIQTALDTCGQLSRRDLESLLPLIDILLFDVKEMDREKHRRFTGRGNAKILENLRFVGEYAREHGRFHQFWIRTPLIPEATARAENIRAIGAFIAGHLDGVIDRWELCAFNNLCRDKYRRLGLEWDYARSALLSREQMESFAGIAKGSGVDPAIVFWSGITLLEKDEGNQAGS